MIILGVILLLLGALLNIGILYTLGGILAVVGIISLDPRRLRASGRAQSALLLI
ncbi:MAG TPA: hypothetical protein VMP13_03420 [Acidimicrobiia bacterium]|nr:hypothetical protein [Acidimicrobiia bacterium]